MANRGDQQATPVAAPDSTSVLLSGPAIRAYEAMLADVPEASGSGYEAIAAQLAQAQSLADLEAPWRTEGGQKYLDQWLTITGIRKVPSDYAGGLGWFLVVDAATIPDGERVSFTTGSVNVVAQLVRAHALDLFPLQAKLVNLRSNKPGQNPPQRLVFTE